MTSVPVKRERCKQCGYSIRSAGHERGPQHTLAKVGKKIVARPRRYTPKLTPKASAGRGFDFDAIKRGGV